MHDKAFSLYTLEYLKYPRKIYSSIRFGYKQIRKKKSFCRARQTQEKRKTSICFSMCIDIMLFACFKYICSVNFIRTKKLTK